VDRRCSRDPDEVGTQTEDGRDRSQVVLPEDKSASSHYTRDLVYERIAPGLLDELEKKTPPNEKGHRPNRLHQWLTEDVGNPMLAQHLHSLIMFQRLALNSGFGWNRFTKMVDRVMPKRGNTLELPFPDENTEG
jgi:P63C domain